MRVVEITMEKRMRVAIKAPLSEKEQREVKEGENPLFEIMKRELDLGHGYVEYDYAVADAKGNTIVDWRNR